MLFIRERSFIGRSYRDFRESSGPSYSQTLTYWNVTAARLAFIIVFEHLIFFIVYLMQWLVSDVPTAIENKIAHERYIDQRERWASKMTEDHFQSAVASSEALTRLLQLSNTCEQTIDKRIPHSRRRVT
jgi:hypothetical protein